MQTITETMASIRWLLEKHLGKYDHTMSSAASKATERRESRKLVPINSTLALEVLKRHKAGQQIKSIARELGTNEVSVGHIVHRRISYATLPHTKRDIIKWFKERNRE